MKQPNLSELGRPEFTKTVKGNPLKIYKSRPNWVAVYGGKTIGTKPIANGLDLHFWIQALTEKIKGE